MRRLMTALFVLPTVFLAVAPAARAQSVFKIATLAPEGSSWMKLYHEWANNVEKRTSGRVKIKFFAGGVQGDEREAVQKMRGGLINGAGVTGVGLGQINEEVRVLELPFLFHTYDEIDHVRSTLAEDFQKKFNAKGYMLLGWGDVGWIYIYSNIPIKSKEDIAKTKMWAWTDDPVVRALFKHLAVSGVPLGVPDVYTSLQTGVIDACYGSPLAMVALQWYTKVKFQTSDPISMAVGATVVTKKDFDKLSGEDQKSLLDESAQLQTKALATLRRDNDRAATKMKQVGLQVVQAPTAFMEEMKKQGMGVWDELADHMYSKAWLEKIKKILADYRKAHG